MAKKGKVIKACYHGSWIHLSGMAGSQQNGHNGSEMGYSQANFHTPVLPAYTGAKLVEKMRKYEEGEC